MTLPANVRAEVKQILDAAARRLLEQQLAADDADASDPPTDHPLATEEAQQ